LRHECLTEKDRRTESEVRTKESNEETASCVIFPNCPIEEIVARHQRGEKVAITTAAAFPSEMFPAGSSQEIRVYTERSQTKWGTLLTTFQAKIRDKGMDFPEHQMEGVVNPITGEIKKGRMSYWIVRPDGVEQFTGYSAEIHKKEPPSLDSLITKTEYIS
jgi:hypothetical protein